jgi:iron complex outermembrane receptor protein
MKYTNLKLAFWSAAMALLPLSAAGQEIIHETDEQIGATGKLEEIVVLGRSISMQSASVKVEKEMVMDTASALKQLPGGDVNANGRITGIAQYRGMYGDRVSVTIDGIGMIGGGPNAMDTPLSYVSPMITEDLVLERGIPGVGSAPESVGGHVNAKLARGSFSDSADFGLAGTLGTRYSGNGNSSTSVGRITAANDSHKLSLIAEADRADDISTPAGNIFPSGLSRDRADVSYAFSGDNTEFLLFAGILDTEDAGTPALAMDIGVIDTQIYGTRFRTDLTPTFLIDASIGYNDVYHEMDNFSLRTAPANPMGYRQNTATGSGTNFEVAVTKGIGDNSLRFGVDGRMAAHESLISNPENPMFLIENFSGVQRDLVGVFAVWQRSTDDSDWELGLRFNEIRTDAGTVSASGLMGMMGDAAGALADAFNDAARDKRFNNIDVVAKYQRPVFANAELHLELGSKTRAPSYQELYLWLPLQATGGLADGRNYIGNLDLESERSNEINIGLGWSGGKFEISPQVFYKKVDNYIQGVPSSNTAANMLAMMMSGAAALEFANVDAEIYGFDLAWKYQVTDKVFFDGLAAYARGRRTDVTDNLYRLAPANASVAVNYVATNWAAKTEVIGYAQQDKVSAFNGEQPSAGYGVLNASASWNPWEAVRLEARIDNLFDRSYQDHLAGVNRVVGSDIPVGSRLYGLGRSLSAGLIISF